MVKVNQFQLLGSPPVTAASVRLRTTPQQARSQARIDAALEAAVRLLETEGLDAVTTTRIASEAGMAVGSVYRYFPDRAAILDSLWKRYLAEFGTLMDDLGDRAERETWDDPVDTVIEAFVAFYRARPALRAIWFGGRLSDDVMAADRDNDLAMAEGLKRLVLAQGLPHTARLDHQAYTCVIVCDALLKEAFRGDPQGDPALLAETKAILNAYLASMLT
jgi:AcrR family transcriptional regulator